MTSETGPVGWQGLAGPAAVLAVLGSTTAGVVLLVASVGPWAAEEPRASLIGTGSLVVDAPVPLEAGETYVRTELSSSGDLQVVQWIESDAPLFSAVLEPPPGTAARTTTVEQLRVVADGRLVQSRERASPGQSVRFRFPGVRSVQIRYRLRGVLQVGLSPPGRALAPLTALDVTYEPASTRVIRDVVAPEVLSLACSPPGSTDTPRPCGTNLAVDEWTVDLVGPFTRDRVIAAVSLE